MHPPARLAAFALAAGMAVSGCEPIPDQKLERLEGPMSNLAEEEGGYLIRTDFSDDAAWRSTLAAVLARYGIFQGTFHVVDDPAYANATKAEIAGRLGPDFEQYFFFIVDRETLSHPERPVLVVDLGERSLNEFRAIPAEVGGIQINLSLANMDFEDFSESADADGIFRGFGP
jgi:hypothetical protein